LLLSAVQAGHIDRQRRAPSNGAAARVRSTELSSTCGQCHVDSRVDEAEHVQTCVIIILYDILLIVEYQVSTTVMDLVVVFALFVFMLALLCFCVATVFSVNKDLYIKEKRR